MLERNIKKFIYGRILSKINILCKLMCELF